AAASERQRCAAQRQIATGRSAARQIGYRSIISGEIYRRRGRVVEGDTPRAEGVGRASAQRSGVELCGAIPGGGARKHERARAILDESGPSRGAGEFQRG